MSINVKLLKHLTTLAKRRKSGLVTADDAQRLLTTWRFRGNRNLIGGLLRSHFSIAGETKSVTPSNKSRTIRVWAVR